MKLAIIQIVLGALIVGLLVWFIGWVEPDYGSYTRLIEGVEVKLLPVPGWIMGAIFWKTVSFLLGLAILSCGIVQYKRARARPA